MLPEVDLGISKVGPRLCRGGEPSGLGLSLRDEEFVDREDWRELRAYASNIAVSSVEASEGRRDSGS